MSTKLSYQTNPNDIGGSAVYGKLNIKYVTWIDWPVHCLYKY